MAGTFGYELDITKLTDDEKGTIKEQIAFFHRFYDLIQYGDYYRLQPPESGCSVWEFASADGGEALVSAVYGRVEANAPVAQVRIHGLMDDALYRVELCGGQRSPMVLFPNFTQGGAISGAALRNGGLPIPPAFRDYQSWQYHIKRWKE